MKMRVREVSLRVREGEGEDADGDGDDCGKEHEGEEGEQEVGGGTDEGESKRGGRVRVLSSPCILLVYIFMHFFLSLPPDILWSSIPFSLYSPLSPAGDAAPRV
eukprot:GHVU01015640.1.p2 GENE.GHVU01015640.1~~GHVU01015640.1.p2  ORF type:complete len:104 (-),score=15.90 GHVU01015640.1:62-373(-)